MYRIINEKEKGNFQNKINDAFSEGYVILVWEGFYSGTWSCLMTTNPDHPKVEVKNV